MSTMHTQQSNARACRVRSIKGSLDLTRRGVGLPDDWIDHFRLSDDWAFFIKLAALCDGAIEWLLVSRCIPTRRGYMSFRERTNLATKHGLLLEEDNRFLHWLATERNRLAHDISTAAFNFHTHVLAKDDAGKRAIYDSLNTFARKDVITEHGPFQVEFGLDAFLKSLEEELPEDRRVRESIRTRQPIEHPPGPSAGCAAVLIAALPVLASIGYARRTGRPIPAERRTEATFAYIEDEMISCIAG